MRLLLLAFAFSALCAHAEDAKAKSFEAQGIAFDHRADLETQVIQRRAKGHTIQVESNADDAIGLAQILTYSEDLAAEVAFKNAVDGMRVLLEQDKAAPVTEKETALEIGGAKRTGTLLTGKLAGMDYAYEIYTFKLEGKLLTVVLSYSLEDREKTMQAHSAMFKSLKAVAEKKSEK